MEPIAFDIETIPNEALIDQLPEIEPPKNYKDPEKIEAYLAEKKVKQIQDMALSPFWGKVCCAVFKDTEILSSTEFESCVISSPTVKKNFISEGLLVTFALETIATRVGMVLNKGTLVTWNGMGFDIPFLYTRAIILGVVFPSNLPLMSKLCRRYSVEPHCDLMQLYAGWDRQHIVKLDLAARMILGKGKKEIDVSTFSALIKAGNTEPILRHCEEDVDLTLALFDKAVNRLF